MKVDNREIVRDVTEKQFHCWRQMLSLRESSVPSNFHDTSLQGNMKCEVCIRRELYAMSCCQVARQLSSADREIIRDFTGEQFHC